MPKVMLDVVVRGEVVRGELEKRLEFVSDDFKPLTERRCIIPVGDASWMEPLDIDQNYRLTIDDLA